jgi:putative PIN family toxin of toxin-antitoxin system
MRVIIDTHILISALLSPSPSRPPAAIINHAVAGTFDLIVSETTIAELNGKIASKDYLASRLPNEVVELFIAAMRATAVIVPEITEDIPLLSRDRKDDYLLMHAVIEDVDLLATGDKDLLVLGEIAGVRIVSPTEFVAILEAQTDV